MYKYYLRYESNLPLGFSEKKINIIKLYDIKRQIGNLSNELIYKFSRPGRHSMISPFWWQISWSLHTFGRQRSISVKYNLLISAHDYLLKQMVNTFVMYHYSFLLIHYFISKKKNLNESNNSKITMNRRVWRD